MSNGLAQNPDEILTEIAMSSDGLPWLIVEGESDGIFFSSRHIPRRPKPMIALGWENVCFIVTKAVEENLSANVIGFLDQDYRNEIGLVVDKSRTIESDHRDLEISMFESSALKRILAELGSSIKLPKTDLNDVDIEFIKDRIYSLACCLGRLRFYSLKNQLGLRFRDLDYSRFVDSRTLEMDSNVLFSYLNSRGSGAITLEQFSEALECELPCRLIDRRNLCSGHDLMNILGIALRRLWGTNNSSNVSETRLLCYFRIGYPDQEFQTSTMYIRMTELLNPQV